MVAFYNESSNNWNRAIVDYHFKFYDKTDENYVIWLVDLGHPLCVTGFYLRPLDPKFSGRKLSSNVIKVGVLNVLPVSQEYDFLNECSFQLMAEMWDSIVVRTFKDSLEFSSSIEFKAECSVGDHYFGKIMIEDVDGETKDAIEILTGTEYACEEPNEGVFMKELLKIGTISFERYHDNNGQIVRTTVPKNDFFQKCGKNELRAMNMNYLRNVEVIEPLDDCPVNDIPKNIPVEMHSIKKVERWLEKCITMTNIPEINEEENEVLQKMPLLTLKVEVTNYPALRKVSSHKVSRSNKHSHDSDNKSEIIQSKSYISDDEQSQEKPKFGTKILELLAKRRAAKLNALTSIDETSTINDDTTTVIQPKRVLDVIPACYSQVISQYERAKRASQKAQKMETMSTNATVITSHASFDDSKRYMKPRAMKDTKFSYGKSKQNKTYQSSMDEEEAW